LARSDVVEKKIGKMLSDIRTRLSFDLTGTHAAIRLLPAHSELDFAQELEKLTSAMARSNSRSPSGRDIKTGE
jgi:hypothetical protein